MNRAIQILTIVLLIGCQSQQEEAHKQPLNKQEQKLRSVLKNKEQCELIGIIKNTDIENLRGIWTDTLIWRTKESDSCYFGFEELDRHISLEFRSSSTYSWQETYTLSERNFSQYGEYFLSNDSNKTELVLTDNGKENSISAHGDTLKAFTYRLYWTDSARFFLLPPNPAYENYRNFEVIEFKKTKANN